MNAPSQLLRIVTASLSLILMMGLIVVPSANAQLASLAYSQSIVSGHLRLADDPYGGRLVEVVGDLESAEKIAVIVPGVGNSRDNFGDQDIEVRQGTIAHRLAPRARALRDEVLQRDPSARVAVIAWLGYTPPPEIGPAALETSPADAGAVDLAALRAELPASASVTWVCHSYGTLVCAAAASSNTASQIVLLASPGIPATSVDELETSATVWAARNDDDPIRFTPLLNILGLGFGADPTRAEFGASPLISSATGGHSGYFRAGSPTMKALADVIQSAPAVDSARSVSPQERSS